MSGERERQRERERDRDRDRERERDRESARAEECGAQATALHPRHVHCGDIFTILVVNSLDHFLLRNDGPAEEQVFYTS